MDLQGEQQASRWRRANKGTGGLRDHRGQTPATTSLPASPNEPLLGAAPPGAGSLSSGRLSETYPGHKSSEAQLCRPGARGSGGGSGSPNRATDVDQRGTVEQ